MITGMGSQHSWCAQEKAGVPSWCPSNLTESLNLHWTESVCRWVSHWDLMLLHNKCLALTYKDQAVGIEDSCSRADNSKE